MTGAATDWNPGIVAAVLGVLLGIGVLWLVRRRRGTAEVLKGADAVQMRDLEARRDVLYEQLNELRRRPGDLNPADAAGEQFRLEMEAARTLKAIEELRTRTTRPGAADAAGAAAPPRASAVAGFIWGVSSMAVLGALVFFVSQRTTERDSGAGATGTVGGAPQGGRTPGPEPREITAMREAVAHAPQDVAARLALVRALLNTRDLVGVFEQTEAVLQVSPGQPEALSYQALVRIAMGQPEMARDMLQQALKTDPDLVDGYLHLALAQVRLGEAEAAKTTIATAVKRFPQQQDLFRRAYAEMTAERAAPPPPQAAAAHGTAIAGTIALDPALAGSVARGALVFIVVRPAGTAQGPPAAAKRLVVDAFPVAFAISDADSMAGASLPQSLRIDVRIDKDGNPLTREPDAPHASLDAVAAGQRDLRLVLRR